MSFFADRTATDSGSDLCFALVDSGLTMDQNQSGPDPTSGIAFGGYHQVSLDSAVAGVTSGTQSAGPPITQRYYIFGVETGGWLAYSAGTPFAFGAGSQNQYRFIGDGQFWSGQTSGPTTTSLAVQVATMAVPAFTGGDATGSLLMPSAPQATTMVTSGTVNQRGDLGYTLAPTSSPAAPVAVQFVAVHLTAFTTANRAWAWTIAADGTATLHNALSCGTDNSFNGFQAVIPSGSNLWGLMNTTDNDTGTDYLAVTRCTLQTFAQDGGGTFDSDFYRARLDDVVADAALQAAADDPTVFHIVQTVSGFLCSYRDGGVWKAILVAPDWTTYQRITLHTGDTASSDRLAAWNANSFPSTGGSHVFLGRDGKFYLAYGNPALAFQFSVGGPCDEVAARRRQMTKVYVL